MEKNSLDLSVPRKRLVRLLGLFIIALILPVTLLMVQIRQETRQKAAANFEVGFNISGIVHYGYEKYPSAKAPDIDVDLAEMKNMKASIVRVFAANNQVSDTETSRRLNDFLNKAAANNVSVIISLIDFYHTGHNPQGTDQYYSVPYGATQLLSHDFFASGYRDRYLSFVRTLVNNNKNHANIYAWEIGNEIKDDANTQTFIDFVNDVSSIIKSIDSSHPVSIGMINAQHTALTPDGLYGKTPKIDIITVHPYNGYRDGTSDVQWAVAHGKKAIVEEIGVDSADRPSRLRTEIDYWRSIGAQASLQWGFIARGLSDNGNGDNKYGMDTIWHNADYDQLFSMYLSYTTGVFPTLPPGTPIPTGGACPDKPGACRDNPCAPPFNYKWEANCASSGRCDTARLNADCPKNTTDPSNVNPDTSNWCFGFEGPNNSSADFRCLILRYIGPRVTPTRPPAGSTPTPTPTTVPCNQNSITMTVAPNTSPVNGSFGFTINGDASTYITDSYDNAVKDCTGPWNNKTCVALNKPGTYKWIHGWKACVGDFQHCSAQCSKEIQFTITSGPTATNTPPPAPTATISPNATMTPAPTKPTSVAPLTSIPLLPLLAVLVLLIPIFL